MKLLNISMTVSTALPQPSFVPIWRPKELQMFGYYYIGWCSYFVVACSDPSVRPPRKKQQNISMTVSTAQPQPSFVPIWRP